MAAATADAAAQAAVSRDTLQRVVIDSVMAKHALDSPVYKFWWRRRGCPDAGSAFAVGYLEENGRVDEAATMRAKLPQLRNNLDALRADTEAELSALDGAALRARFLGEYEAGDLGSYVMSPSIFHKGSDTFVKRCFPGGLAAHDARPAAVGSGGGDGDGDGAGDAASAADPAGVEDAADAPPADGLTCDVLRSTIPLQDWDFALKSWVRANAMDVTAHGEYMGSATPVADAVANAAAHGLPPVALRANQLRGPPADIVKACVLEYQAEAEPCQGGRALRADGDGGAAGAAGAAARARRRGWASLVCLAAAIGVHEQNLNGGWEQVAANIVAKLQTDEEHAGCLLNALGGFLLVGDVATATEMATFIAQLRGGGGTDGDDGSDDDDADDDGDKNNADEAPTREARWAQQQMRLSRLLGPSLQGCIHARAVARRAEFLAAASRRGGRVGDALAAEAEARVRGLLRAGGGAGGGDTSPAAELV